jgi:hypothetical protein
MEETHFLKLVYPPQKSLDKDNPQLDQLSLFKGVVINLNEGALNCLNRISRQEMQKNFPSPTLMEEYSLLHHYLDFIRRLCQRQ